MGLVADGRPLAEISRVFGVSKITIKQWADDAGLTVHNPGPGSAGWRGRGVPSDAHVAPATIWFDRDEAKALLVLLDRSQGAPEAVEYFSSRLNDFLSLEPPG